MKIGPVLHKARRDAGLGQAELAMSAGVSLATLQNIESGRANPSLATITALGNELGLTLSLVQEDIDWNLLVEAGVPLATKGRQASASIEAPKVVRELRKAFQRDLSLRERKAVAAFMLAILNHFPTVAKKWFSRSTLDRFSPEFEDPAVLKLKRISTAIIATYL